MHDKSLPRLLATAALSGFCAMHMAQAAPITTTFTYGGPAIAIPNAPSSNVSGGEAVASLDVAGLFGPVTNVVLTIGGSDCSAAATSGIEHTWVGDLLVQLRSPSGTAVTLISRLGRPGGGGDTGTENGATAGHGGDNFCQVVLNDAAATDMLDLPNSDAPYSGVYRPPYSPLSTFQDEDANGTWELVVQDFFSGDTGSIRAWSLALTTDEPAHSYTADISGIETDGAEGNPGNTILTVDLGPNAVVTGFTAGGTLTAFAPSWLSDARVWFHGDDPATSLSYTPGFGGNAPGIDHAFGGIYDLGTLGFPNITLGSPGLLTLEFAEHFADAEVIPEARFGPGSFITIHYANGTPSYTATPYLESSGGGISPTTPQTAAAGEAVSITVTPDAGFIPAHAGSCGGSISDNVYTSDPLTADCTVGFIFLAVTSLPAGTAGQPYAVQETAPAFDPPDDAIPPFTLHIGSLPPGLSLNPDTGEITGTPTQPGTYVFGVRGGSLLAPPPAFSITISAAGTGGAGSVTPVPTLSHLGLLLVGGLLAGAGAVRLRRKSKG